MQDGKTHGKIKGLHYNPFPFCFHAGIHLDGQGCFYSCMMKIYFQLQRVYYELPGSWMDYAVLVPWEKVCVCRVAPPQSLQSPLSPCTVHHTSTLCTKSTACPSK